MINKDEVLDLVEKLQDFIIEKEKTWNESNLRDREDKLNDRCNQGKVIASQIILIEISKLHQEIYLMKESHFANASKMVKLEDVEGLIISAAIQNKHTTASELIEKIRLLKSEE